MIKKIMYNTNYNATMLENNIINYFSGQLVRNLDISIITSTFS